MLLYSFITISPYIKNDMVSMQIGEKVYLTNLEECENHLYGQIFLAKRDKPVTHLYLCKMLDVA